VPRRRTDERRSRGPSPRSRPRRTAAAARRAILAAAERRLVAGGPEAIRLQDIARDVGVSHPAVLHHFGSRENLVEALAEHAIRGLEEELLRVVRGRPGHRDRLPVRVERVADMLERTSRVLAERRYARLLAWLVLSGRELRVVAGRFAEFPQAVHAARIRRRGAEGRGPVALESTRFGVATTMLTLLGEALFGRLVRLAVGLADDPSTRRRFRRWMARAIEEA
jgi:AcrR family transcriptional regulator